jgi:hypothetical protein
MLVFLFIIGSKIPLGETESYIGFGLVCFYFLSRWDEWTEIDKEKKLDNNALRCYGNDRCFSSVLMLA